MTALAPLRSLSVIVPTYGDPAPMHAALRSLAVQRLDPASVEIVVVDDGSPCFDAAAVPALAGPLTTRIVPLPVNQGRARARNAGLRAATGDLVVFLDSDMTVAPGFLMEHLRAHVAEDCVAVIGNIRYGPEIAATGLTRYLESRGVNRLRDGEPVPYKCFVTGNSSVRRCLLDSVGGFDERFRAYGGEDLELGYRLHRAGAQFRYAPQAASWHHHARSLDDLRAQMSTYGARSLPVLVGKHPELASPLRLDFLDARACGWLRRRLLRMALLGWPCRLVSALVRHAPQRGVPPVLYDYLLWHARTRAYLGVTGA